MQTLKPWLNDDYIHTARFDDKGNFTLMFVDGGQKVYQVDDCTEAQIKDAVELLKKNGVSVLK
jgi:beta-lactam-binding protein with PASTA domain